MNRREAMKQGVLTAVGTVLSIRSTSGEFEELNVHCTPVKNFFEMCNLSKAFGDVRYGIVYTADDPNGVCRSMLFHGVKRAEVVFCKDTKKWYGVSMDHRTDEVLECL